MTTIIREFRKGPGIIISTVMWEFFSIFGLRALLIFYLTQKLGFTDISADRLYAGYISLIWISPLIGGWIADRYLGFKNSVILGSLLIVLGHIIISMPIDYALYAGLSCLICGIGFFKTNAICLVGSFYQDQPQKLTSIMTLYYVGANIGATLAPAVCAYLQQRYGYQAAFVAAAVGMLLGLLTLFFYRDRLKGVGEKPISPVSSVKLGGVISAGFVVAVFGLCLVLKYNLIAYVLWPTLLLALIKVISLTASMSVSSKRRLVGLLCLTLLGTAFWILDQQAGSSISLFISRNVMRNGIPAGAFQSINPFMIIVGGIVVASYFAAKDTKMQSRMLLVRVVLGIFLLTLGYAFISASASYAAQFGLVSMWPVAIGLAVMGLAELFIDPVILAGIGQVVPLSA